jgi:hypothetical protein
MELIAGIHIDFFGSLKEFYYSVLDESFWKKINAHRRDPTNNPIPVRPNLEANFNPRCSNRTQNRENPQETPCFSRPQR